MKKSKTRNQIKGGYSAADYGVYVWGQNQTSGYQGNVIHPANNPMSQTGGDKKRFDVKRKKNVGGNTSSTMPGISSMMAQNTEIANAQMLSMTKPMIQTNITSDSVNRSIGGGRKKIKTQSQMSKKKIYTKNKRNGKRRTTKIR